MVRAALTSDQNGFGLKLNQDFWRCFVEAAVRLRAFLFKGIAIEALCFIAASDLG